MSQHAALRALVLLLILGLVPVAQAVQCTVETTSFALGVVPQSPNPSDVQSGSITVRCAAETADFAGVPPSTTFQVDFDVEVSGSNGSFAAAANARAMSSAMRGSSVPFDVKTGSGCSAGAGQTWGYTGGNGVICTGSFIFQLSDLNAMTGLTPPQTRTIMSGLQLGASFSAPPASDYADSIAVRLNYRP